MAQHCPLNKQGKQLDFRVARRGAVNHSDVRREGCLERWQPEEHRRPRRKQPDEATAARDPERQMVVIVTLWSDRQFQHQNRDFLEALEPTIPFVLVKANRIYEHREIWIVRFFLSIAAPFE
jgi:hypothetical protein